MILKYFKENTENIKEKLKGPAIVSGIILLLYSLMVKIETKSEPDVVLKAIENSSDFAKEAGLIKNEMN